MGDSDKVTHKINYEQVTALLQVNNNTLQGESLGLEGDAAAYGWLEQQGKKLPATNSSTHGWMDGSLCSPAFLAITTHHVPQVRQDLPQSVSRLVSKRLEKQMFPSLLSTRNKGGHIKYRSSAFQNNHCVMMDGPVMPWCVRVKDPELLQLAWILTGFHILSYGAARISLPLGESHSQNRGAKRICFYCAHQCQMDSVKNLFATTCTHKLLTPLVTSWKSGIFESGSNVFHPHFLNPAGKPACSISAGTEAPQEGQGRDAACGTSDEQLHPTHQEFRNMKSFIQGAAASLFVHSTFSPYLVLEHVCACS